MAQCVNYENSLSHFFDKTFVKATFLLKKLLKSWFHDLFFVRVNILFFHTVYCLVAKLFLRYRRPLGYFDVCYLYFTRRLGTSRGYYYIVSRFNIQTCHKFDFIFPVLIFSVASWLIMVLIWFDKKLT